MQKRSMRKKWTIAIFAGILAANLAACGNQGSPGKAKASSYPDKSITVIAPSGAGGGLDTTARSMTKILGDTKMVAQTMVVENKPGGGQSVGLAEFVTKHKNDDFKLLLPSTPIIMNNLRKEGNSPHSFRDMKPLAQLTKDYEVIAVRSDSKYNDLKSLMDDFIKDPSLMTVAGGSAPGSLDHLGFMLPAIKAGIDVKQVKYLAYDGGGEAITALLGGSAHVLSTDVSGTMEFLKAGKIKVLAVSSPTRLEGEFKDIPTYKEAGYDTELTNWRGIFGPKEMSEDAVKFWDEKLKELTSSEEWKKELVAKGWDDGYKNAADFTKYLEEQEAQLKEVLTTLGMAK